jgi:hypothetical protein
MKNLILTLCILVIFAPPILCENGARQRLEADIRFLADDLLEGRGTPSRGLELAALYIANELRASGIEPGNNGSYYQNIDIGSYKLAESEYSVTINGMKLNSDEFNIVPWGMDVTQSPLKLKMVFADYGIFAPSKGIDNYEKIDARGKAVIAMVGAPWDLTPQYPHSYDLCFGKWMTSRVHNASAYIYVSEDYIPPDSSFRLTEYSTFGSFGESEISYPIEKPTLSGPPMIAIKPAAFDRVLAEAVGGTYSELQAKLKKGKSLSGDVEGELEISIEIEPKYSQIKNVLGIIPGSDNLLKNEWIVLTAHYDHTGKIDTPEGVDGIFNGADDNASGVAAVLEMARRFTGQDKPKRSVLVVFCSAEEIGMMGSGYYSLNPIAPIDDVIVNINIDMVGRSEGSMETICPGSEELFERLVAAGKNHDIEILPDQHPTWRIIYFTDTFHFARFYTPAIECITGIHGDVHRPSDEADLIKYDNLTRVVETIFDMANYSGQGGKKPKYEKPEWFLVPDIK